MAIQNGNNEYRQQIYTSQNKTTYSGGSCEATMTTTRITKAVCECASSRRILLQSVNWAQMGSGRLLCRESERQRDRCVYIYIYIQVYTVSEQRMNQVSTRNILGNPCCLCTMPPAVPIIHRASQKPHKTCEPRSKIQVISPILIRHIIPYITPFKVAQMALGLKWIPTSHSLCCAAVRPP